ncbi:MAG: BPL-N domain-containing protein, partial [Pseudomonadota bacterium]|nr:BPL-N domain-containing protein [Pseudomonadota bacterium]
MEIEQKSLRIYFCVITSIIIMFSLYVAGLKNMKDSNKNRDIYIYSDDGVSPESLSHTLSFFKKVASSSYKIKTLDAENLITQKWQKNTALLVMPGGADIPYTKKLNGLGNKIIKEYVSNGGKFLGICAGSYFGSNKIEFDKNGPLEVIGTRELAFFPGTAIGPVLGQFKYRSNYGAKAADITYKGKKLAVFYNGGPYFSLPTKDKNTDILAYYDNKEQLLPAILKVKVGSGEVILSGVHFEYDASKLNKENEFLKNIIPKLVTDDAKRLELGEYILNSLGIASEVLEHMVA